jgi:hypothetical protein
MLGAQGMLAPHNSFAMQNMTRFRSHSTILTGLLLLASSSCSGGAGPKITGMVTLDNKPLADAQVEIKPLGRKTGLGGAITKTDENGRFEVRSRPQTKQTLKPGKYVVLIAKWVDKNDNVPDKEEFEQLKSAGRLHNKLPSKYNDEAFPAFPAIEIKEGDNDLKTFALKNK